MINEILEIKKNLENFDENGILIFRDKNHNFFVLKNLLREFYSFFLGYNFRIFLIVPKIKIFEIEKNKGNFDLLKIYKNLKNSENQKNKEILKNEEISNFEKNEKIRKIVKLEENDLLTCLKRIKNREKNHLLQYEGKKTFEILESFNNNFQEFFENEINFCDDFLEFFCEEKIIKNSHFLNFQKNFMNFENFDFLKKKKNF